MYNSKEIEAKWQKYWDENKTHKVENDFSKPKFYALDMFPYPSGAGLHVGHPKGYTANDIVARYKNAKWFNVLHPIGWDAFGLPAENYAIKTWTHPRTTTDQNIETFKRQIKALWFSYDWDREIDTTDPEYFKWTQWIFLKLFENGLAYEQDMPINYCPSCKTGLANEEVLNDFTCERCSTKVEKKKLRQWVLAITKYADRLHKDVDKLDWPEGIKEMQKNWIWKSEGCEFELKKAWDESKSIRVYTTRVDTVFGMTYAVIAPDHPHAEDFITEEQKASCEAYIDESNKKSDLDRTELNKEKTWVFTGSYVVNPFNGKEVPLWIGDYVLGSYGTWAVMAVPAHDERDFEFAKKYDLEIIQSIQTKEEYTWEKATTEYWVVVDSGEFTELSSKEAKIKMTEKAEKDGFGHKVTNYKLRDWLFSRQRYWGEPIPLIHLELEDLKKLPHISDISEATDSSLAYILKREPKEDECNKDTMCSGKVRELIIDGKVFSKIYDGINGKMVCDYRLPLELPQVENYEPAWDGNSPLAMVEDFVNVELASNLKGKRETNTMPQWGWSCWYYLRFMDPRNSENLVSKEAVEYWNEVDSYVWGAEHAVLHLLYARFWHKFLYDINVVPTDEPFFRLRNQGLILGPDGEKMSKSKGNVINPDEVIEEYWADTLRMYEMSMADFKDPAPWDTKAIVGIKRFLEKSWNTVSGDQEKNASSDEEAMKNLHKAIKKVWEDIENYKFNTSISALIILLNGWTPKDEALNKEFKEKFTIMLSAFAPFVWEELWEKLWNETSVFFAKWPEYDESMTIDSEITVVVSINWKVRDELKVSKDISKDDILALAKETEGYKKWTEGKDILKEIYVPGKLVNIVVK